MKIGAFVFFGGGGRNTDPDFIVETARLVEDRGYHSIWVPEHVVFFRNYASKYPYSRDGKLPVDPNLVPFEPLTVLSFIAGQTRRIRLGTGITIVPQRNPVYTAKQVADVDVLSNGRLDFGIGVGWLKEEFDALHVPFAHRGARANDYLEVMKALWTQEESRHTGPYYELPPAIQGPKPVQKPHPPIYVGGESDAALKRVARHGQGWFAVNLGVEALSERLAFLDAELAMAGRSRADVRIAVTPYMGDCDMDMIKRYRDMGVDQVILTAFLPAERLHATLDQWAKQIVEPAMEVA
jgi:probable F420-dependent oxidoreductase